MTSSHTDTDSDLVATVTYDGKRVVVPMVRVDEQRFYEPQWLKAHPEDASIVQYRADCSSGIGRTIAWHNHEIRMAELRTGEPADAAHQQL